MAWIHLALFYTPKALYTKTIIHSLLNYLSKPVAHGQTDENTVTNQANHYQTFIHVHTAVS